MADLSTEGLNQINESVKGVGDGVSQASSTVADAVKEGLHEIKEEILKVAVQSLPREFLDLAKQVELMTTYTQKINQLTEDRNKKDDEEKAEKKSDDKPGTPAGWSPEKLASKLSERESAPALTIIQSINDIFGEKGFFIGALEGMLKSLLTVQDQVKKPKEEKDKPNNADLKGPDDKLIGQYSAGIKKLDKLFGNILKTFFKSGKPRFSEEQIKTIETTAKIFSNLSVAFSAISITTRNVIVAGMLAPLAIKIMPGINEFVYATGEVIREFRESGLDSKEVKEIAEISKGLHSIFESIMKAEIFAIAAGILAIPAALMALFVSFFIASSSIIIRVFDLIDLVKVTESAAKATALNTIFKNVMLAEIFALAAGVLAIPAAIMALLVSFFVISSSIVVKFFDFINLKSAADAAIKATALNIVFKNIMLAEIFAVAAGTLAIPAVLLMPVLLLSILGMAILLEVFDAFFKIPDLIITQFKVSILAGIMLTLIIIEGLALVGGALAIPGIIGIALMAVFMVGVFLLSMVANLVIGSIVSLVVVSLMIFVAMLGMGLALKAVVDIKKFIETNLSNNAEAPGTGTFLDSILGLMFALMPMALIMVGFFFIGALAILCIIPMLGLLLFSVIAMNALPLFQRSLVLLFDIIKNSTKLIGDMVPKGGFLEAVSDAFPPLGTVIGLVAFLGSIVALIVVMIGIAVLGLVALATSYAMVGLKKWAEDAKNTLPAFGESLPMVFNLAKEAGKLLGDMVPKGGILEAIGKAIPPLGTVIGLMAFLGNMFSLIMIMVSITVLGLVALAASAAMDGLKKFGVVAPSALESLGKALPLLGTVITAAETAWKSMAGTEEKEGNGFMSLIGKIPVIGDVVESFSVIGKFVNLAKVMIGLAVIGLIANGTEESIKTLKTAGEAMGVGIPGIVTGLKQMPALSTELSRVDIGALEKQMKKLTPLVNALGEVGAGFKTNAANIEAIKSTSEAFKVSLTDNILKPTMQLDPAITKLNELKSAAKGLNEELKKMASENKDALVSLGSISSGGENGAVLSARSSTSYSASVPMSGRNESPDNEILSYIAGDVHGIAQKVITKETKSWADKPIPGGN
jgi:predicted HTH domain antitoxin